MSDVEYGSFEDIQEIEYVKLNKEGVIVKFETSNFIVEINAYKNKQWSFAVSEDGSDKLLSVTSKRLMLTLKQHHPLAGKTFLITRKGVGMEIDYDVEEVVE